MAFDGWALGRLDPGTTVHLARTYLVYAAAGADLTLTSAARDTTADSNAGDNTATWHPAIT